jgi:hypothetical protein
MRFLAVLLFFNKGFMTEFSTTIGNTIYLAKRHEGDVEVLAHEYTHVFDSRRYGAFIYSLQYLFPQCLALLSLLSLGAIATPWWPPAFYFITALVFLGCLAPLPAPWREKYEFRGYKMSLVVLSLSYKQVPVGWAVRQFFSTDYYYGKTSVIDDFNQLLKDMAEGKPLGAPFDAVVSILRDPNGAPQG